MPLTYSGFLGNTTLPVAHLVGRLGEVADVVRGLRAPAPLLAAPEHPSGWIHAATLVDRLTRTPDPAPLDLVAALLRLHQGGRTTTGAGALPAAVQYALGGPAEPDLDRDDPAVWVAAGRTRTVTEVDPVLLRLRLGGAGRAHPLDARVHATPERRSYEDRGRVQAVTFWRWGLEVSDPVHHVQGEPADGAGAGLERVRRGPGHPPVRPGGDVEPRVRSFGPRRLRRLGGDDLAGRRGARPAVHRRVRAGRGVSAPRSSVTPSGSSTCSVDTRVGSGGWPG